MVRTTQTFNPDLHRNGALAHKLAPVVPVVRCIASFGDGLTQKQYVPGDVVEWTVERAKLYPQFVVVE